MRRDDNDDTSPTDARTIVGDDNDGGIVREVDDGGTIVEGFDNARTIVEGNDDEGTIVEGFDDARPIAGGATTHQTPPPMTGSLRPHRCQCNDCTPRTSPIATSVPPNGSSPVLLDNDGNEYVEVFLPDDDGDDGIDDVDDVLPDAPSTAPTTAPTPHLVPTAVTALVTSLEVADPICPSDFKSMFATITALLQQKQATLQALLQQQQESSAQQKATMQTLLQQQESFVQP